MDDRAGHWIDDGNHRVRGRRRNRCPGAEAAGVVAINSGRVVALDPASFWRSNAMWTSMVRDVTSLPYTVDEKLTFLTVRERNTRSGRYFNTSSKNFTARGSFDLPSHCIASF